VLFCLKKLGFFVNFDFIFPNFFLQILMFIKGVLVRFNRFGNLYDFGSVISLALTGQLDKSN
jgi:hypothetical protein